MIITKDHNLAEIIQHNYLLLTILPRFEINLGFGDKTVEQVCLENNVDTGFFLEIINSFNDKSYFSDSLHNFSLKLIVQYLQNTHTYYLHEKIPEIENLMNQLIDACMASNKNNLMLLKKFFDDYKTELNEHIKREEQKVLPYVLELDEAYKNKQVSKSLINKIHTYSIHDYANEHDNVEEKLHDLKNIIIKYLPPTKNSYLCHKVLIELFRLERDLNDHSHIEDKVLVPRVYEIEKMLLNKP